MSFFTGSNFGERAMTNDSGTRAGTCIAEKNSFCAIVDRPLYLKIIKKLN